MKSVTGRNNSTPSNDHADKISRPGIFTFLAGALGITASSLFFLSCSTSPPIENVSTTYTIPETETSAAAVAKPESSPPLQAEAPASSSPPPKATTEEPTPTTVVVTPKAKPIPATNLKTDEHVLVFPTNAVFDEKSNSWRLNIHGWVFEPERDSLWRNGTIKSLALFLGVDDDTEEGKRFAQRTAMFLVDNERNKNIVLSTAGEYFSAPTTGPNGHFEFDARLPPGADYCQQPVTLKVQTNGNDSRSMLGEVQCVQNEGISVISDIDDTIKDSNVLDKKALLTKTFLKEFSSVEGMSAVYRNWHKHGYQFHYVSSSPWQLYPVLSDFLDDQSFPRGSMHLKLIRVKDKSIFNLLATPEEGKIPTITSLLETYPQRRFILVGDSGEKDPDIYATIAQQYPDRIIKIYIHNVTGDKHRIENIFKGIPRKQWVVFSNANEILNQQALLNPVE